MYLVLQCAHRGRHSPIEALARGGIRPWRHSSVETHAQRGTVPKRHLTGTVCPERHTLYMVHDRHDP